MSSLFQNDAKSRFDKLSLKKNRKKSETERKPDHPIPTIILDESFDNLISCISNRRGDWKHISSSPIVIDDSFKAENCSPFKVPDPVRYSKNVTPETCKKTDLSITPDNGRISIDLSLNTQPSIEGWSPGLDIICASPKFTTPSQAKDIANESMEECSIKKIREEHTNILDELYGDTWKSIPTLFKKKSVKSFENLDGVTKKLDFLDDNDKENVEDIFDSNIRKFYEDNGFSTPRTDLNTDTKKKKKLYTAKEFDTPEVRKIKKELLIFSEKTDTKTKKKPYTAKRYDTPEVIKIKKDLIFTEPKPKIKPIEKKQNSEKKATKALEVDKPLNVKKFSFMGSLADNIPSWRCDPEALEFKNHYKTKRDQLTRRLFKDFNRLVFNNELEDDMPVVWEAKLRTTAGMATNRQIKSAGLVKIRTSSIKLSSKVIDGPQRLRDTLIHEMCHCATWIIDHELRAGHGPLWKKWAKRALKVIPELEEISRCHNLEIHFKYSYKCTQCGYTINRHSKSIDLTKKCCGYCRGKFELVLNKKNKDGVVVSTPAKKGEANEFALFVKKNYANFKDDKKTHAQVMKVLAERYSEKKKS